MKRLFYLLSNIFVTIIIIGFIPMLVMFSEITFEDAVATFVGIISMLMVFLGIILSFIFINNKMNK